MKIIPLGDYSVITVQEGVCTECGNNAYFVETLSEARFCSIKCCDKFYKRYDEIFELYLEETDENGMLI